MNDRIEAFLASLMEEKGYSNNTIVAYRNDLTQFCDYLQRLARLRLGPGQAAAPGPLRGRAAQRTRVRLGHRGAQRSPRPSLSSGTWSIPGHCRRDPSEKLDSPKVRKYLPTSISEEEVERLLQGAL